MSIIYDALKKVDTRFHTHGITRSKKNNLILAAVVFAILAIITSAFFTTKLFSKSSAIEKNTPILQIAEIQKSQSPELAAAQTVFAEPVLSSAVKDAAADAKNLPNLTNNSEENEASLPAPPLTLNGIFFSEEDSFALINNQIVKEGDTYEGKVIKKISEKSVELEGNGDTIKLATEGR